jgi:hypothetical protein
MTDVVPVPEPGAPTEPVRSADAAPTRRRSAGKISSRLDWLWADRRSKLASGFLAIVILLAIFAPLVSRYGPADQNVGNILRGPSAKHWLGTDDLGRDVWSRLVYGARVSMEASLIAVGVALLIGVPVGLLAGYIGGWLDTILMRVVDTLLAFPAIVLAVGITAALGPGLVNAMVAVGVVFSPSIARISRAQVLTTKERLYVDAAVGFGSPSSRTIARVPAGPGPARRGEPLVPRTGGAAAGVELGHHAPTFVAVPLPRTQCHLRPWVGHRSHRAVLQRARGLPARCPRPGRGAAATLASAATIRPAPRRVTGLLGRYGRVMARARRG